MLKGCSRVFALRVRSLDCFQRAVATAPKSLLDLLTESTSIAPPLQALEDEVIHSVEGAPKRDHLRSSIVRSGSTKQLLEIIQRHGNMMNGSHLLECWRRFHATVEAGADLESLKADPGFYDLLDLTCAKCRGANPGIFSPLSHFLRRFEFSADSDIVRNFCRGVGFRLGDIPLGALVNIQSNLRHLAGTSPDVDVLLLSVPVVFLARMRIDLAGCDSVDIYQTLMFVLRESFDPETVEFVANTVLLRSKGFSAIESFYIVNHASRRDETFSGSMRELLGKCLDTLIRYKSEFTMEHIQAILKCCQRHQIGSRVLLDAFWSLAPSWPSETKVDLLKLSFQLNHVSLPVAELALDITAVKKEQVIEDFDVLKIAEAVALVNLHHESDSEKETHVALAKSILVDAQDRIDDALAGRPHQLPETLFHLATVGIFPEELLNKLFDESFQKSLCGDALSREYVVELEQCLDMSLGASNPYRTIPELRAVSQEESGQRYIPSSLFLTLRVALGGEKFVAERVKTPLGIWADYVIAMRGGEYAMAFAQDTSNPFEKIPPGSKVIAILLERDEKGDSSSASFKKLQLYLRERHLRAQNFCTLRIDVEKFELMRPYEKTPFVMKRIKEVAKDGPAYSPTDLQGGGS